MNIPNECIEFCSAKVEHLRKQISNLTSGEVKNKEECESSEYKAAVAELKNLSPNWAAFADGNLSLEAVKAAAGGMKTDSSGYTVGGAVMLRGDAV